MIAISVAVMAHDLAVGLWLQRENKEEREEQQFKTGQSGWGEIEEARLVSFANRQHHPSSLCLTPTSYHSNLGHSGLFCFRARAVTRGAVNIGAGCFWVTGVRERHLWKRLATQDHYRSGSRAPTSQGSDSRSWASEKPRTLSLRFPGQGKMQVRDGRREPESEWGKAEERGRERERFSPLFEGSQNWSEQRPRKSMLLARQVATNKKWVTRWHFWAGFFFKKQKNK